jgi:predicted amidohydrolase
MTASRRTRIACRQLDPQIGDLEANRELSVRAIREAAADGADIVVLPELVTSGYMLADEREARAAAIGAGHQLFSDWSDAAGSTIVVGGFCEAGPDGRLYNSAAVVDGSGVRAVYRKTHLWDREKLIFTPGDDPPPLVETPQGRIGVLICYDLEFPEMTRSVALAGADLIAVPTNWPLIPRPRGERPPEVVIAMAAARVNHVPIACCDRTTPERGQHWTAGTHIIDESGWVVAAIEADGTAIADLDLTKARDKSLTGLADLFVDRRPELYSAVGSPGS